MCSSDLQAAYRIGLLDKIGEAAVEELEGPHPTAHYTRDALADQSYDNIGVALQFFKSMFGRNSIDGRGMRVDASVHYGYLFPNAMWTGEQMIVGDGDGHSVRDLAGSLGIIAHELAHGISQHLIKGGLGVVQVPGSPPTLKGEAGALNESFSDVMASMIKQWHGGQDVHGADWLLGEAVRAGKLRVDRERGEITAV